MSLEPIAYTYEADVHCPECASARFGMCPHGDIGLTNNEPDVLKFHAQCYAVKDREGNELGVIAPWDQWLESDESAWHTENGLLVQTLNCGTCHREIDRSERFPDEINA